MLRLPPNPRFFSTKPRKELNADPKWKKKKVSGAKAPPPTPPPPPLPPIPRELFKYYSPASSTPLPPPAMPRKRLVRRALPFLVVASGAYLFMRTSEKESSKKDDESRIETSFPV